MTTTVNDRLVRVEVEFAALREGLERTEANFCLGMAELSTLRGSAERLTVAVEELRKDLT